MADTRADTSDEQEATCLQARIEAIEDYLGVPLVLDTHQPYPSAGWGDAEPWQSPGQRANYLGGLRWSSAFTARVGHIGAELRQEWWRDEHYVLPRLRARLGTFTVQRRTPPTTLTYEVIEVVLAISRDHLGYWDASSRYKRSVHWISKQVRKAEWLVRHEYRPIPRRPNN